MKAAPLLRVLGLGVLVFGLAWLAAVVYWRGSGAEVTAGHLLVWLLCVPLVVLAAVLGIRALVRRRRAAGAIAAEGDAGNRTAASAAEPDRPLFLHAGAVWTRVGADPGAVAQALVQPVRPPLHPALRDSMGLPVFAAGVEDLDPDHVAGLLSAGGHGGGAHAAPAPHVLRALALLEPVAEDLLLAALDHGRQAADPSPAPVSGDGLHPHAIHHSRSAQAAPGTAPAPSLHVYLLLPAGWPAPLREAAAARVAEIARGTGLAADRVEIEPLPAARSDDCWALLDRIAALPRESAAPRLLLAADSMLDPRIVDRLEARGELLVSGHLEGRIPGEAAAGLLLAPDAGAFASPLVTLHGTCHASAGRGRAAAGDSAQLLQSALDTAALEGGEGTVVFTDADHRPSRAVEAAGAITSALPEADLPLAARHLGLACGDTGIATPLVLLAVAAAHVSQADAPALVLALAGDGRRTALAVSPTVAAPGIAGTPEEVPAATGAATA